MARRVAAKRNPWTLMADRLRNRGVETYTGVADNVSMRYKFLLPDGKLWMETKSLSELLERSAGVAGTIHRQLTITVVQEWQPVPADEVNTLTEGK